MSDPCPRPIQTDRHGQPPLGVSSCPVGQIGVGVWCLRRGDFARSLKGEYRTRLERWFDYNLIGFSVELGCVELGP